MKRSFENGTAEKILKRRMHNGAFGRNFKQCFLMLELLSKYWKQWRIAVHS